VTCAIAYLCKLVACLTLPRAQPSTPQSKPPTIASLGSALAAPYPAVERPRADDYDAWQQWAIGLLHQYATCAARHAKTAQAWPK
jgi:hypothetical protein